MNITLNSNCVLKSDKLSVGYCEENKAETLNIFIQNEKLYDKEIRLEFQVNNGKKYTTDELELLDGHIEYSLPNGLLSESGTLALQLVFRDQNGLIKKSNVLKLHIHQSICASDELAKEYPDFIGEAQKVIDELNGVDKIQVIDLVNIEYDEYFIKNLTLEENNTYLIHNSAYKSSNDPIMINFGMCKDIERGKFINFGSGADSSDYWHNYCSGQSYGSYVSFSPDVTEYDKYLYIIVRNNDVFINLTDEV